MSINPRTSENKVHFRTFEGSFLRVRVRVKERKRACKKKRNGVKEIEGEGIKERELESRRGRE